MDQAVLYIDALEAECKRLQLQHTETASLKPRIAAWGLVKAGKSSLLNMLSGHVHQEYFATGAVRTSTYSGTPVTALLSVRLLVELKYCWASAGAWKPVLTDARNATPPSSW